MMTHTLDPATASRFAAAALVVADRAADLAEGAALAAAVIDDGRAARALADLVEATNAMIEEEPA